MSEDIDRNRRNGEDGKESRVGEVLPWTTLGTEKIADCHIFSLHRHHRTSSAGTSAGTFHTISAPDWVNVIALTEDREMVMIRQYRHGTDEMTWEIPGGMIDPGERPEEAARRELLEETGYEAGEIHLIGSTRPNPALFDNTNYTALARNVRLIGSQSLDEHEEIHVAVYSPDRIDRMVREGEISHALVINALYWLMRVEGEV